MHSPFFGNVQRMRQDERVSNTYFSDLLAAWAHYGFDTQTLLEGSGVSLVQLQDPGGYVSLPQFQCIMHNAVTHTGIEGFALRAGQQITPNAHGSLGLAFLSSQTVDDALILLEKYAATQTDLVQFSLRRQPQFTCLIIEESRPLGSAYVSVMELALSTLWFALRLLSAGQLRCESLHLRYPLPTYQHVYKDIFQCPVEGDHTENALKITSYSLSLPLLLGNPVALQRALTQCAHELERKRGQESIASHLQRRLLRSPGNFPSFQQLCEELAMSERTLRRRLADENTSFQALLNETRRQLAERYLLETQHSVYEIAWLLGYQDPSNFGNAFKRWHGMAPSDFRQRQSASPGTTDQ